mmetsp:Transcript_10363/g.31951  ORF Transcript_10363/g.31951 Transcript_10363/m.31951 type:complete len:239 (-) Transcript_10363:37-753(-)
MEIAAPAPCRRPADVEGLLNSPDVYAPASIPALEAYVAAQVKDGTYDFAANKALVKLYQFEPASCKGDVLAQVLAKALMARPAGDLDQLLYMAPDVLVSRAPVAQRLADADALLEANKYGAFWAKVREGDAPACKCVAGFEAAVRRFLLDLLSRTFERVPLDLLAEVLGCDAAAAAALAKAGGGPVVASSEPSVAVFSPNAHNQKRAATAEKAVSLASLLGLYGGDDDIFGDGGAARQ